MFTTSPDYPCEGRGDVRTGGAATQAETVATPRCLPVPNFDGRGLDHVRHGKHPLQSPMSPAPCLAPPVGRSRRGRRVVHVQDIVVRLLITSQLETH